MDGFGDAFQNAKEQFRKEPETVQLADHLERDGKGNVYPHVANALVYLAHDPTLAGLIRYNEFDEEAQTFRPPPRLNQGDPVAPGPYPRPVRQSDIVAITAYIQRAHKAPRMAIKTIDEAIHTDAERRRFHPVREWLAGLRWDGTHRLDTWLCNAFGAPDTPYTQAVGAKMLMAAVRRVRQPGCKFDEMPILEGLQGAGKSRTVRRLFGSDWFTDSMPPDLKSKDSAQAVLGIWCVEFAEIEHLVRTDTETLKAFLSRPTERFRPPYAKSFMKRGRECIFIGTTNATDYLRDTTGNRRFWPIKCEFADEGWVSEHREQLWAEAAMREASGEILWLEEDAKAEAIEAQSERIMEDVWSEKVREWLQQQKGLFERHVTVPKLLADALGLTSAQMDKKAEMRAGLILAKEGMKRDVIKEGNRSRRVWRWPD